MSKHKNKGSDWWSSHHSQNQPRDSKGRFAKKNKPSIQWNLPQKRTRSPSSLESCLGTLIFLAIVGFLIFIPVRCVHSIFIECPENSIKTWKKNWGFVCEIKGMNPGSAHVTLGK